MDCGLNGQVSIPGRDNWCSLLHTGSGTHPASYSVSTGGALSPGREADHATPPRSYVKTDGAIPSLPHMSLRGVVLNWLSAETGLPLPYVNYRAHKRTGPYYETNTWQDYSVSEILCNDLYRYSFHSPGPDGSQPHLRAGRSPPFGSPRLDSNVVATVSSAPSQRMCCDVVAANASHGLFN
jgi:hypothetical protein